LEHKLILNINLNFDCNFILILNVNKNLNYPTKTDRSDDACETTSNFESEIKCLSVSNAQVNIFARNNFCDAIRIIDSDLPPPTE
jgi:hypothetical protein